MERVSNKYKTYIDVAVLDRKDGVRVPMYLIWTDGRRYTIDKVIDVRPKASVKAAGVGIRYTCLIGGNERYLFYEEDRWFVENKS